MTKSPFTNIFAGRTRLVTAASIVAVGVAGAAAVSANVGILNSASDSPVGSVSVTGDLTDPAVVDVVVDGDPVESVPPVSVEEPIRSAGVDRQELVVDEAGTLFVALDEAELRVDEADLVDGWSWESRSSSPDELVVVLTGPSRVLEMNASRSRDGTLTARVDEPIVSAAPRSTAPARYSDDGYDDDDDDDDADDVVGRSDDDDGYDDDDDDDYEYEGGDDDD